MLESNTTSTRSIALMPDTLAGIIDWDTLDQIWYAIRGNCKTQVEQGISGQNSRKKVKWCPRKRQNVGLPQLNIGHYRGLYKTQHPDATTLDSTT